VSKRTTIFAALHRLLTSSEAIHASPFLSRFVLVAFPLTGFRARERRSPRIHAPKMIGGGIWL
jgi:hypothetical protein